MIGQDELRLLEEQCVQECAPACAAACPLHVDVRGVMAAAAQGDMAGALKLLMRTLPFPGIIGRVCERPCEAPCKRGEVGDVVQIRAIERACADLGGRRELPRVLPKRPKRVAVVGGGLSGLTAAYDLARKGYTVTVHEARAWLGGSLWESPEELLPRAILEEELAIVEALGVKIQVNAPLPPDGLVALRGSVDAVYLATGVPGGLHGGAALGLAGNGGGRVAVDPVTFATSLDGVFAGGDMLRGREERSLIRAMSDGRRAAISIDRYLQKVSLAAARSDEGGYESCLYTNTAGIALLPAKAMDAPEAGYSLLEAAAEAGRCIQCECMECVKSCEYLRAYGRYPRKYLREIYNNLSIVKGERKSNQFINSCSLCGLCAEICPEGLGMAPVVKLARETMVAQNRMPPSAHDFALRDMAFSNGDNFALARNRPGMGGSDVVFFPGCQLAGSAPEQIEQVYDYLCEKLGRVGLVLRCCGAPADWAGRTDLFQAGMAALGAEIARLGATTVVTACSSCFKVFTANLPRVTTVSLWEIYEQHGLPPEAEARGAARAPAVVAVHDPCSTRHEAQMQESARALIRRLGYTIEELPLNRARTECCSYGGVMWLANRPLAEAVVQRRIAESPSDYVTYCSVCRDFFAARGKPSLHLLDMIYAPDPSAQAQRASPDFSQRHENRARLKRRLLKQLWGETMDGTQPGYEAIKLVMSDEVRARMERRLILVEDLQRVIEQAERTGRRLRDPGTGHLLAYYKPTAVTYWVEYAPEGEGFAVYNAYSHRMEIAEGGTA